MRTGLRMGAFGFAAAGIVGMTFWVRADYAGILLALGAIGILALLAGWRADWLGAGMVYLGAIAATSVAGNPANVPAMARLGGLDLALAFALGYLLGYSYRRWYRHPAATPLNDGRQALPDPVPSGSRRLRYVGYGVLGWVVPGLVALPFAWGHESAGGESALLAVLVWWGLGVLGCMVAGVIIGAGFDRAGSTADAFSEGLVGVCVAWLAALAVSLAIETFVGVLHLGPVTFLLPIPFVLGYGTGFGIGYASGR